MRRLALLILSIILTSIPSTGSRYLSASTTNSVPLPIHYSNTDNHHIYSAKSTLNQHGPRAHHPSLHSAAHLPPEPHFPIAVSITLFPDFGKLFLLTFAFQTLHLPAKFNSPTLLLPSPAVSSCPNSKPTSSHIHTLHSPPFFAICLPPFLDY